jgi:hypothetical protein
MVNFLSISNSAIIAPGDKIMRRLITFLLLGISTNAMAQTAASPAVCPAEQAALNAVSSEFKPQLDSISSKGDDLKKDSEKKTDLSLDFKVEMKEQKWVFDLPSVTMRDQQIVMGIPEIRMNTQEFSFDVPETVMVAKKVGQYPETVVDGFNVTVRWKDIITYIPEVRMLKKSFKLDIPETMMRDTVLIFGVPEFKMERQEWFVKIPEFTLKKIEIGGVPAYNDYQERGKEIEKSANDVKGGIKSTLITRTNAMYACLRNSIGFQRVQATEQLQKAIEQVEESSKSLTAQGISPDSVKIVVDGKEKTMAIQLEELRQSLADLDKKFSDTLLEIDNDEKAAVSRIAAG